jgi:hypothetical protein
MGVSESGYHAFDVQHNYQYQAFGVPGLGLRRGLADDMVIAPYATLLALMVSPHKACDNLLRLEKNGARGEYGFYEALDYTLPPRNRATVCGRTVLDGASSGDGISGAGSRAA